VGFPRSSRGIEPTLDRICGHRHGLIGNRAPECTLRRIVLLAWTGALISGGLARARRNSQRQSPMPPAGAGRAVTSPPIGLANDVT